MVAARKKPPEKDASFAGAWLPLLVFAGLAIAVAGVAWWFTKDREAPMKSRVVERQQVNDGLGWGSELLIDKKKSAPAVIRFMLRDQDRNPIIKAKVQITFVGGPPKNRQVIQGTLKEDEPGVYRGYVNLPQSGTWNIQVNAQAGDNAYQNVQEAKLP
jgi:hypothetical protein